MRLGTICLFKSQRGSSGLVKIIASPSTTYLRFIFIKCFYSIKNIDTSATYLSEKENFRNFKYLKKGTNA